MELIHYKSREKELERYKEELFAGIKGHKYEEIAQEVKEFESLKETDYHFHHKTFKGYSGAN